LQYNLLSEEIAGSIIEVLESNTQVVIFDVRNNAIGINSLFCIHQNLERNELKLKTHDDYPNPIWLDLDPMKVTYHYMTKKITHRMHTESSIKKLNTFPKENRAYLDRHKSRSPKNGRISKAMKALDAMNLSIVQIKEPYNTELYSKTDKRETQPFLAWHDNPLDGVSINACESNSRDKKDYINMNVNSSESSNALKYDERNLVEDSLLKATEFEEGRKVESSKLRQENKLLADRLNLLENHILQLNNGQESEKGVKQILEVVETSLQGFNSMLDAFDLMTKKRKKCEKSKKHNNVKL
jgi:hypothetical protein